MTYEHAAMLVRRLFAVIGRFAWQLSDLDIEIRFLRTMCRKYPDMDWNDVLRSIRIYES